MRVPALPDRGGTHLHLEQPARQAFLQEHGAGEVRLADLDQRRQQRRRTDEAGADPAVGAGDRLEEIAFGGGDMLSRDQVPEECQSVGRLVVVADAAGGGDELALEGGLHRGGPFLKRV